MHKPMVQVGTKLEVETHAQVVAMAYELGYVTKRTGQAKVGPTVAHLVEVGLEALEVRRDTAARAEERQQEATQ